MKDISGAAGRVGRSVLGDLSSHAWADTQSAVRCHFSRERFQRLYCLCFCDDPRNALFPSIRP